MRKLRNVTVTLEESAARWVRVQAARENKSVSRFLGAILEERMRGEDEYDIAMERYLSVKPKAMSRGRKYPRREQLYDRPRLR